ncbi:nuclear transport factor 2 family protein [Streptomyces sp. JJ36]|uniref:nuclear transport factor 2 family protein n=1 Tax=Streptomyces sp. JJ36 TaxID=2736645 RepID=UPI001F221DC0|nr:nuclear transport factor 2 family protein [Streptomyces sp. JJ36]MCF6525748.1 nuclear transport factor 2 family protein [Streptomyces sp. JJ36]
MSTAAPASTRAVVEELLRRIGEGDPEHIAGLYADQVDWKLDWPDAGPGSDATPWIRHRSTRADAAAHFRQIAEHHVPGAAATAIERVLVDGHDAVVLGEIRQTARPTGRSYRARFALHLTVEEGRVTRHHVYEDSLSVARAFAAHDGARTR